MKPEKSTILIVDDIPTNIQVIGNLLRINGYDIAFTDNGKDAIEMAQNNNYDLILLDIMMPVMDGYEVCKTLKNIQGTKSIPIIFLTAKSDPASLVKGFDLGAVDFVTKPFKTPELLARVQTHITLKKTTEELQATNAMKDKLMSIIAHDLRGPVGNFGSALTMLIENLDTFNQQMLCETMNELNVSASRVFELLENLLAWARSQNNEIEFQPVTFNICNVITNNIELLENSASQKQISFIRNFPKNIEISADINMINTVLRNLLTNAIKYSNAGGKIEIKVQDKNHKALISVRDFGVGIDKNNLENIFSPNRYYSTYGTSNEKGTGLGLKLCKDFVTRNRGEIFVESRPGHGSIFSFTLPKLITDV